MARPVYNFDELMRYPSPLAGAARRAAGASAGGGASGARAARAAGGSGNAGRGGVEGRPTAEPVASTSGSSVEPGLWGEQVAFAQNERKGDLASPAFPGSGREEGRRPWEDLSGMVRVRRRARRGLAEAGAGAALVVRENVGSGGLEGRARIEGRGLASPNETQKVTIGVIAVCKSPYTSPGAARRATDGGNLTTATPASHPSLSLPQTPS